MTSTRAAATHRVTTPSAAALPTPAHPAADNAGRTATGRALLRCGAAAGPVFVVLGLAHAALRPGFDMAKHPVSMLALGDTGWIQTASFLVSGLLTLLWAVGLRRVAAARWLPVAVAALGVGLVAAGAFPADPALGFPDGAPAGAPEAMSATGALHAVAFGVAMLGWLTAAVLLTRHFAKAGERGWAVASGAAVAVLLAPLAVMGATPVLYASSVLTWTWVTAVAVRLSR